jgi:hypothetical protein
MSNTKSRGANTLHFIVGQFFDCEKHGWSALGAPCPKCREGDAPRACGKHGWSHAFKGCPVCMSNVRNERICDPAPIKLCTNPENCSAGAQIRSISLLGILFHVISVFSVSDFFRILCQVTFPQDWQRSSSRGSPAAIYRTPPMSQ